MEVSTPNAKDDAIKTAQKAAIYSSNDLHYLTPQDRPATAKSIELEILSDSMIELQSPTALSEIKFPLSTTELNHPPDVKIIHISKTDNQQRVIRIPKTEIKSEFGQSKLSQVNQQNIKNTSSEVDAILARKMSSLDVQNGARPKNKQPATVVVVEEPKWREIGEYEDLRRTKCRRLYSRLGKSKDLALFYRGGKFYAMEAWCSHMGGPLFEGDIEEHKGSCHVMCPWHAYMFELSTGRSDIGLQQQVYPVKCEDGRVFVEYLSPLALYPYL